jgi:hypothetical protein
MKTKPGKGATMKPEKKLRKRLVYNLNQRINRARKEGRL